MKEIWQKPRAGRFIYGCDFCKKTAVKKETMIKHESICYWNPNRSDCPVCDGQGNLDEWIDGVPLRQPCPACEEWKRIQKFLKEEQCQS